MFYTEEEMLQELKRQIELAGSQRAWALKNGVSTSFLNDTLLGRKKISAPLAKKLGYERKTIFATEKFLHRMEYNKGDSK